MKILFILLLIIGNLQAGWMNVDSINVKQKFRNKKLNTDALLFVKSADSLLDTANIYDINDSIGIGTNIPLDLLTVKGDIWLNENRGVIIEANADGTDGSSIYLSNKSGFGDCFWSKISSVYNSSIGYGTLTFLSKDSIVSDYDSPKELSFDTIMSMNSFDKNIIIGDSPDFLSVNTKLTVQGGITADTLYVNDTMVIYGDLTIENNLLVKDNVTIWDDLLTLGYMQINNYGNPLILNANISTDPHTADSVCYIEGLSNGSLRFETASDADNLSYLFIGGQGRDTVLQIVDTTITNVFTDSTYIKDKLTVGNSFNLFAPADIHYSYDIGIPTLVLGADGDYGATTRTDEYGKSVQIGLSPFDNDVRSVGFLYATLGITSNDLHFGGGTAQFTAATNIDFYTSSVSGTTGGTRRMIIDSLGQVGIGTGTPLAILDVCYGGLTAMLGADLNLTSRTDNTIKWARMGMVQYDIDEEGYCLLTAVANESSQSVRIGGGTSELNAATDIIFYTADDTSTTSGTARMRITKDGKVGVNEDEPDGLLHVTNSPISGFTGAHSYGDDFVIENDGYAGMSIVSTNNIYSNLIFASEVDDIGAIIRYRCSSGTMIISTDSINGDITFRTGAGVNAMYIDSAQNIGIGNTDPNCKLDIEDDHIRIRSSQTITNSTDAGTQGDICWDANYIYICTATNNWVRASLSTW